MNQEAEASSEAGKDSPNESTAPDDQIEPPARDGKPVQRPDPTRYGDWEKNGRCIDF